MSEPKPSKPQPHLTDEGAKVKADREARQAAALRRNLARRKAQSREREDEGRTSKG